MRLVPIALGFLLAIPAASAEGIAQFMAQTAKLRGLKNSFNYREALPASAEHLAFLRGMSGNLGLGGSCVVLKT